MQGFDEFWSIYPRKVGKQGAERAYKKALKVVTSDAIFGAAQRYARDRSGQDVTYTAHPATWLNAGRWDDYPPQALPPSNSPPVSIMGVYVAFDAPEMDAWTAHERKTRKSFPRDRSGGWWFPSRLPPSTASSSSAVSASELNDA